ncbi:scarecrow-like protein 27 [Prosopis cineraria]|uniref:scarecrow-like protein 27 n=1 Tax=Prosopis cineraria TaxID=364024 RepID=UPI00240E9FB4|nr:scarecrow-like protein 27 [Prosopis cineraria]
MKAVPLPFEEFRGKGVLDFGSAAPDSFLKWNHNHHHHHDNILQEHCYVGTEPISVLNVRRNPSPPTSSSTLSSSHGGGGSCSGATGSTDSSTGAAKVSGDKPHPQTALDAALPAGLERCGIGMEDWESVLSESPGQDQSILRMIMGDIEDPSVGLSKLLQGGTGSHQDVVDFNGGGGGGFGVVDQSSVLDHFSGVNLASSIDASGNCSDFPFNTIHNVSFNNNMARVGSSVNQNPIFPSSPTSLPPGMFQPQQHQQAMESLDEKPQILNPQFIVNPNQAQFMQNSSFVMPLSYEHQLLPQPPAKRPNCGPIRPNYQVLKPPFLDPGQEIYLRRGQQPPPLQLLPHYHHHHHLQQQRQASPVAAMAPKQRMASPGEELVTHQLQQSVMDKLFKATEMIETGNPELAQGILARLNHQLSPTGKPFQRAAFYMKEALQSLLFHLDNSNSDNSLTFSPSGLVLKIGACKSFSEISPVLQFSNFTCNQALLEAVEGFDRIHVVDFDIGVGGQWASFMQELALRNGGSPSLKITAFVSPSNHDNFELGFTQEILKQYASDLSIPFELEILGLELLNTASWPQPLRDCEAIAVSLPIASFSHCPSYLPLVLRFLKQLMPKIVVTVDRPCDRTDAPFAQHLIYALQSYSVLLESLDAVNMNLDVLQMIEKYLIQPAMEKLVLGRHRLQLRERTPQWKTLLLTSGFSPLALSNFTESQAECLVQRNPGRGFHVEKKQSSLVLYWQRKELISVSTWGC